jgi:Ca-activated chloride channel homolog
MRCQLLSRLLVLFAISISVLTLIAFQNSVPIASAKSGESSGSLQVLDSSGKPKALCPLKHTEVKAEITGFLSRVLVTQEFENPFKEKIEAVYTFPLPQNAAVDDMTMTVGDRTVRGKILRREQAQAVYEAAKTAGQVASLLDQERPNIFTQSVANIMPGEQVKVALSYVQHLKYEDGSYEFVFPMVVGPRYIPGAPTGSKGGGALPDTDQVPDASRITPKLVPEGMRSGHDISIDINLDAGLPIESLNSKTQELDVEQMSPHQAHVRLKTGSTIPNKDFILRYDVAGKKIDDGLLTHRGTSGGYFTLILQPPERVTAEDVTPKELVFVLDTSGSMSGFPIEKAKETMTLALNNLYPADTFNLITFSGDTRILFPEPVSATPENLKKARDFLSNSSGYGGTEMMKAIKASLDPSDTQDHIRIVCFMTDGYVGNDMEIISEIQKHPNARVFAFGIGGSVNRFLLDKMAEQGRGEVEYVGLNDDGSAAARRFHERVRNPLLTDISVDWNGLPVADVYPQRIPDLFGAKPVILSGRFTAPGRGVVRLKGKMGGQDFVREIQVDFPESASQHDVLASLWARTRIDDLMARDYNGVQQGNMRKDLQETITQLGLEYHLMTQFTSFVAVEEMIVTDGGQPRRIDVPVEVPEGVNREAVDHGKVNYAFGAINGRSVSNLSMLSSGVAETVTVSSSNAAIDTSRTDSTFVVERNEIDYGRSKPKKGSKASPPPPNAPPAVSLTSQTSDEAKRQQLRMKLDQVLVTLVERIKNKAATPGVDEAKFVRDGKAELQVWLTEKSAENLAKLKELGFEVVLDPKTSKLVIGKLPAEKIEALAALSFVRFAAPQMRN